MSDERIDVSGSESDTTDNVSDLHEPRRVLVVGASGGTGREAVKSLLKAGYRVSAFSRRASDLADGTQRLMTFNGDATVADDIECAVHGHDTVIITLGISENPFRVRLFGAAHTSATVRSIGTLNVVAAMRRQGVRRLVVQSSYGVGESHELLGFLDRLFFQWVLKPQIEDTERQERIVRDSDLDWTIVQPVHLSNTASCAFPVVSEQGATRLMTVARTSVGRFLAHAAGTFEHVGKTVALSG